MLDHMEYSNSAAEEAYTEPETHSSTTPAAAAAAMRKKRSTAKNNKRRFSDEQIRSLESMFETETRLEPMKKMQLARELGLQPRQVAIWFQNKRARWKSKQLERDFAILRANYNCLASRFDALKKEKHALLIQFQTLNDRIQKLAEGSEDRGANNSTSSESENGETSKRAGEAIAKPSTSTERSESENILGVLSEGDSSIREEYFGQLEDEPALLSFADGSLTSTAEDWDTLESEDLLGQSAASDYQLWDFWS